MNSGGVETIGDNDRVKKTENRDGRISIKPLKSWNMLDDHEILINPSKSEKILKYLGYSLDLFG